MNEITDFIRLENAYVDLIGITSVIVVGDTIEIHRSNGVAVTMGYTWSDDRIKDYRRLLKALRKRQKCRIQKYNYTQFTHSPYQTGDWQQQKEKKTAQENAQFGRPVETKPF
jgi:hypothetical protein